MSFALFMDGDMGEQTGKLVTFIINMVSMSLGFILIPLLPMPLPYIVAFLVAYATYKDKPYGMMTGSLLISLGLIYHLSRIGFFQIFQSPIMKIFILSIIIAPFAICPAIISNNLHIIAIDMGIIAVALLFFEQSFYLAIPLILVFATIYRGRGIAFTFIYYAFISIPLQTIQYLKTFEMGVFPPLYTPLTLIYHEIQSSLSYINLDELTKVFNSISEIFLSRGFERYVTEIPDYIVEDFSTYLVTDYIEYIRSIVLPPSFAPSYVIDSFMQFVATYIPTYENSAVQTYVNSTLPGFMTQNLDPSVWAALPSVGSGVLKLQVEELFPLYVNQVFQAYFREATGQLLNSVPGIVFFLVIMMGFISAITLLNMNMPDPVKESVIPGKYVDVVIYLLPIFVAAVTNLIFFVAIDKLRQPLAFQATVNQAIIINSTIFTVLFSAPVSFSKYLFDLREVKTVRTVSLLEECDYQQKKLERLIYLVNRMRSPVPDNFIDLKTRMLIALDEVKEIKSSTESSKELKEIDENIRRIYNGLKESVESFETQLDVALRDYYIKTKFEYLEAAGEILDLGLGVDAPILPELDFDAPLEEKLDHIDGVIEAGRVLVEALIDTSDKIYEIISSLFEPNLPKDSATLMISREKLEEDEPWVIIDAILISLKNWEKQYSADIVNATRPINDSVETVVQLSKRRGSLSSLLGEKYEEIRALSEHVEARNFSADNENLRVLKVILIRDTILNTVDVVGKIIGILYYHIKDLEFNINLLLPREDFEWNRNLTLTERMSQSLDVINNYEQYRIDELISHLYRVLSYIDEAVDTIEYYNERKEMLLNYPVFEKKITRILDEKDEVKLDELGVSEKYGREYLKMYIRTTYSPLRLEETADSIRRSI
ncbi:MAG: hypothetical protein NWF07_09405 [Candidatus Bathyarchaeota archaeon]|nr:hypothetical protein [Candidatus Bathyarchaeota archaeon]